jgi:hypothetical protein
MARIYTKVILDIETGTLIESDVYDYEGPMDLCARGQAQAADQQRTLQNQINAQQLATTRAEGSYLNPQLQGIVANPVGAPEANAIRQAGFGAANTALDAARESAENRMAKTRNPAGFGENLDELSRERARQLSDLATSDEMKLGDTAYNRKMAALSGLGTLRGQDISTVNAGFGVPAELLKARAGGGGSGTTGSAITGGAMIGAALL